MRIQLNKTNLLMTGLAAFAIYGTGRSIGLQDKIEASKAQIKSLDLPRDEFKALKKQIPEFTTHKYEADKWVKMADSVTKAKIQQRLDSTIAAEKKLAEEAALAVLDSLSKIGQVSLDTIK